MTLNSIGLTLKHHWPMILQFDDLVTECKSTILLQMKVQKNASIDLDFWPWNSITLKMTIVCTKFDNDWTDSKSTILPTRWEVLLWPWTLPLNSIGRIRSLWQNYKVWWWSNRQCMHNPVYNMQMHGHFLSCCSMLLQGHNRSGKMDQTRIRTWDPSNTSGIL